MHVSKTTFGQQSKRAITGAVSTRKPRHRAITVSQSYQPIEHHFDWHKPPVFFEAFRIIRGTMVNQLTRIVTKGF